MKKKKAGKKVEKEKFKKTKNIKESTGKKCIKEENKAKEEKEN